MRFRFEVTDWKGNRKIIEANSFKKMRKKLEPEKIYTVSYTNKKGNKQLKQVSRKKGKWE